MSQYNIAVIQTSYGWDMKANLNRNLQLIRDAAYQGAQIVVLSELHNTIYFCQEENPEYFDLAEAIPGPTTNLLSQLSQELNICIVASIFERLSTAVFHNTAVVLTPEEGIAGCYRKSHIPDDPGFMEKYYFTPGEDPFRPISTPFGNLGVLICWDQWFPEAARIMALQGADILIYPTAIGWDPQDPDDEKQRQLDAWITIQRSHAIANHLPVVVANRCGFENVYSSGRGIDFWGNSFIVGPQGEFLARGEGSPVILLATIDTERTSYLRRIWPFFRDRRIDLYVPILERWGEIYR